MILIHILQKISLDRLDLKRYFVKGGLNDKQGSVNKITNMEIAYSYSIELTFILNLSGTILYYFFDLFWYNNTKKYFNK